MKQNRIVTGRVRILPSFFLTGGCPPLLNGALAKQSNTPYGPWGWRNCLPLAVQNGRAGDSQVGDQETGASSLEEPPDCLPQKTTLNSAGRFTEGSRRYAMADTDETENVALLN